MPLVAMLLLFGSPAGPCGAAHAVAPRAVRIEAVDEARRRLFTLNALDQTLEPLFPLSTGDFGPYWRRTCSSADKAADLEAARFFVEGVRELVERARARGFFGPPRGPAPRLTILPRDPERREPGLRAPRLGNWRHWTNLLVASAAQDPAQAPERLGLALDFAHLVDEFTVIHGLTRVAVEGIVLQGVAELLEAGSVDVASLRRALDGRLARAGRAPLSLARLDRDLGNRRVFASRVRAGTLSEATLASLRDNGLTPEFCVRRTQAFARELDNARRNPRDECSTLERPRRRGAFVSEVETWIHLAGQHASRLRLARLALELADLEEAGVAEAEWASRLAASSAAHGCPEEQVVIERHGPWIVLRRTKGPSYGWVSGLELWRIAP